MPGTVNNSSDCDCDCDASSDCDVVQLKVLAICAVLGERLLRLSSCSA